MSTKIKIAFFIPNMVVGGSEKALLDLLEVIDKDTCEITVFLSESKGEWVPLLEEKCAVRLFRIARTSETVMKGIRSGNIWGIIKHICMKILSRYYFRKHNYLKNRECLIRSMAIDDEMFDCAICFKMICTESVLESLYGIKAKRHIAWLHEVCELDPQKEKYYKKFDTICCVSGAVQKNFIATFAQYASKTEIIHNLLNAERIVELAKEQPSDLMRQNETQVIITTVGRLAVEKGQNMIPMVTKLLVDNGYDILWYVVGDGEQREELETLAELNCVADRLFFLGNRDNPYPYIKGCDIYVQTSYTEGWGLTVSEAKVLRKPIVTTDAGVMAEQITNGINGIIVEKAIPEDLAEAIANLINKPELMCSFSKSLESYVTTNASELDKLYLLFKNDNEWGRGK